jgi:hypothetical protein
VGRGRLGDPCGEVLGTQGKRKIAYVGAREYIRYRMLQIRIRADPFPTTRQVSDLRQRLPP